MNFEGILFSIPWALICLAAIIKLNDYLKIQIRASWVVLAFSTKYLATYLLQLIFTYYYPDRSLADIYRFFDDRLVLNNYFYSDPIGYFKILVGTFDDSRYHFMLDSMNSWYKPFESGFYNDNLIMIRVNSVMDFLSLGLYEVNAIFFSSIAMAGLLLLVKALFVRRALFALLAATLFPGYIIWSSGGLKESLTLGGVGLIIYGFKSSITR